MATVLVDQFRTPPQPQAQSQPFQITDEASLADILRAREQGIDIRQLAAFFKQALTEFEKVGQNLYGRMLLEPERRRSPGRLSARGRRAADDHPGHQQLSGSDHHPRVDRGRLQAAAHLRRRLGQLALLVGSFPVTKQLETKLANFKGTEEACVFATGYSANVGVISAVMRQGRRGHPRPPVARQHGRRREALRRPDQGLPPQRRRAPRPRAGAQSRRPHQAGGR